MIGTAAILLASETGPHRSPAPGKRVGALFSAADSGGYEDPRRFAALVTRYQSRVHRLVAGILGPAYSADAEDATQEVFLLAYRKLASFRGEARISTWLYRLAYNRAIDYRRRLDRRRDDAELPEEPASDARAASPTSPSAPAPPSPLANLLSSERGRSLGRRLDELPPKQRTAVHLHYWLGCTVAEIAELMDSKPATVKSHLFRARRSLARTLTEDEQ